MKILVSPPKRKDLFYHEAQTARKARYIISGLQLLSGTTALIGIRLYFSDWLDDLNPFLQYGILAVIAFMLVAPGEIGIRETWAYIFRAILNRFSSGLNLFSLILMGIVAIFLTSYSFYLSQHATKSSMKRAAPKVELADTKEVSEAYQSEIQRITKDYETQRNDLNKRYNDLILAENEFYDSQINDNEAEIDYYRKKGWATGQRYTSKINGLESKSRDLETKRSESIKNLKEKQNAELTALETWKRTSEQEAKDEKQDTKATIIGRNQALEEENMAFANMFSTLIARFAAWSVILVILFTGYLEVFYYKTGIKRVVQFRSTDFQSPIFVELLTFPYVYLSRRMTNFVRKRYEKLPDLVPAPGTEDLIDHDHDLTGEDSGAFDFEKRMAKKKDKKEQKPPPAPEPIFKRDPNPPSEADEDDPEDYSEPFFTQFRKEEPIPKAKPKAEFRKKDHAPKAEPSFSEDLANIFKNRNRDPEPENRTSLDGLQFNQDVDYGATIKHVDRRTGSVQYFSMDDLDAMIEEMSAKMDDASEMYHDTGDPIYLASIEDYRSKIAHWQSRRVELHQKIHSNSSF